MSRIIELQAENIKRLKAVRIKPAVNGVTQITGQNDQGKTTVLDIMDYVLGGKDSIKGNALRNGAKKGKARIELDEIDFERAFTIEGPRPLQAFDKEGNKLDSPQSRADALTAPLMFDPIEFVRMKEKDQSDLLRQLAGLDFTALDKRREMFYSERTNINRDLAAAKVKLAATPEVEAPDEEVDVTDLMAQHKAATDINNENAAKRRKADESAKSVINRKQKISDLREELVVEEKEYDAVRDAHIVLMKETGDLDDRDTISIAAQVNSAGETNKKVLLKRQREGLAADVKKLAATSDSFTEKLDAVDAQKKKLIADAKYPLPGLAFDLEGRITVNGFLFADLGGRQKLIASVSMAMALNPKLRAIRIDEAGVLDDDGMKILEELAEQHDFQILLSRVDPKGRGKVVVIEDGEVAD